MTVPSSKESDDLTRSIAELTARLVQIPSRAEREERKPILGFLHDWLVEHGVPLQVLADPAGDDVALLLSVEGSGPGPTVGLNACLDTAPFGDPSAWTHDPAGGEIEDGWLYGRGAADSKVAVALFAHLARDLVRRRPVTGRLLVLFDLDEHSGRFGGVRAFRRLTPAPACVMIGYPGNRAVMAGARGFWRASLTTHGVASHSGSTSVPPQNAVAKAARLILELESVALPPATDRFPLGPRLTVTAVEGGEGFSQTPDRCTMNVDVRLTPDFSAEEATTIVDRAVRTVDRAHPSRRPTNVDVAMSWPAYRLDDTEPVVAALRRAAGRAVGRDIPTDVSGPSNIGNFLYAHGIPATCGFGVTYQNVHGIDEAIELASIAPVYETYRAAVLDLVDAPAVDG